MLERYRVLGAMAALQEFTVADIERYSGINSQTVRSVLARDESLVETVGRVKSERPGGEFIKYRIKAERFDLLRKEIREAFQVFMSDAEMTQRSPESSRIPIPLELLAAEDIYVRRFPKARTHEEQLELLSLAAATFSDKTGRFSSPEVYPDTSRITEKYVRYLQALRQFCVAEINEKFPQSGRTPLSLRALRGELSSAIEGLRELWKNENGFALADRLLKSPLVTKWLESAESRAHAHTWISESKGVSTRQSRNIESRLINVQDLANAVGVRVPDVVAYLRTMGIRATIDRMFTLNHEQAQMFAHHFGVDTQMIGVTEVVEKPRTQRIDASERVATSTSSGWIATSIRRAHGGYESTASRGAVLHREEPPNVGLAQEEDSHLEDFAAALESLETESAVPSEDNVFKGTVVGITPTHVIVDIGFKSEGLVPIGEVTDAEGNIKFQPGDEIEAIVQRGENVEGAVLLSHERAQRVRVWEHIDKAYHSKAPVKGRIVERVKGGVYVDIGVKAFMPASQVDVYPVPNLEALKGQEVDVRVIKLDKKRGNIVVSRKIILEEETVSKREKTLEHLSEGAILTGTVKNLSDYGAFVDLGGGIDGLLHITDMSWGRLTHPRDLVHVGDEIHVKVLKFDKDKQRVSLGFKQLTPDPWLDAAERYPVGAHVKGRVISITDYGAFVELEQGIEGLIHVSEMSWSKRMKHPSKIVKINDQVETVILNVNPTERRISLGLKQLESNPWDTLHEKYPTGMVVEGKVRNLTEFGVFVEVEEGIDGLVHVSNMSWTKRVKHPSEMLKKGEKVRAVVLALEPEHRRLSLGIKQLQPDAWQNFFDTHKIGDVAHGKVLRTAQFGAFVQISEGVEALCHNSEAVDEHGSPLRLEPGMEHDFKIVKMNPEEKKVGLSMRGVGEEASRADVEAYKQPISISRSGATTTLGDIISWKRGRR